MPRSCWSWRRPNTRFSAEGSKAMNNVYGPALQYLRVSLTARYARARSEDAERGASAVEWVIISAIVVVIVVTVK